MRLGQPEQGTKRVGMGFALRVCRRGGLFWYGMHLGSAYIGIGCPFYADGIYVDYCLLCVERMETRHQIVKLLCYGASNRERPYSGLRSLSPSCKGVLKKARCSIA